jgi:Fic family protein
MITPPCKITTEILNIVIEITEKVGRIHTQYIGKSSPELRKQNRIKTIHASLKIEGNTLTENQITSIFENKRVLGPQKDILEVNNAIKVYDAIDTWSYKSEKDFLEAHKNLTHDLIPDAGKYRLSGVGIVKGNKVEHLAPPAELVSKLMNDLFLYLKDNKDHDLIKSLVFHYELEFIHPFSDGNGRMGRLWNTLVLMNSFPIFQYIPFETIIAKYQSGYYDALAHSDKKGESTDFILFMLNVINESLEPYLNQKEITLNVDDRIRIFLEQVKGEFTRSDYLKFFKSISSPTASRDLAEAVKQKLIEKTGDKRNTKYNKR